MIFIEKVEDVAVILLLFFVFTGLKTEIGLINDPYLWKVTEQLLWLLSCSLEVHWQSKICGAKLEDINYWCFNEHQRVDGINCIKYRVRA
jgi:hypothetical protein